MIISDGISTQGSDSEEDSEEGQDSCTSGRIALEEDLRSRVQMTLDLVPTLESTLDHVARLQKQSAHTTTELFHASNPAQSYISIVRDKFPQADNRLIERLGEANWERHVNIRKRMDELVGRVERVPTAGTNGSKFQPQTLFHDSGIGTTVPAQSRSAQSEASHTSFVSSLADRQKGVARVPPTPAEIGLGEPFRCYICGQMQFRIQNRVDWK